MTKSSRMVLSCLETFHLKQNFSKVTAANMKEHYLQWKGFLNSVTVSTQFSNWRLMAWWHEVSRDWLVVLYSEFVHLFFFKKQKNKKQPLTGELIKSTRKSQSTAVTEGVSFPTLPNARSHVHRPPQIRLLCLTSAPGRWRTGVWSHTGRRRCSTTPSDPPLGTKRELQL